MTNLNNLAEFTAKVREAVDMPEDICKEVWGFIERFRADATIKVEISDKTILDFIVELFRLAPIGAFTCARQVLAVAFELHFFPLFAEQTNENKAQLEALCNHFVASMHVAPHSHNHGISGLPDLGELSGQAVDLGNGITAFVIGIPRGGQEEGRPILKKDDTIH